MDGGDKVSGCTGGEHAAQGINHEVGANEVLPFSLFVFSKL